MTHGSLFSGIGGFDLAARWCGWTNVFQCENDPFCQRVLKYHFPDTILYEDIKKTDFKQRAGTVDIISGGFPCQPFSLAGKRKGADDDRYLWPEMLRVVREVRPSWVVAENVCGLFTQQHGVVFERVCTDMEAEGYEVQPAIIPACAVGAPHRRERIWFIAHRTNARIESMQPGNRENGVSESGIVADADSIGSNRSTDNRNRQEQVRPSESAECKFTGLRSDRTAADALRDRLEYTRPSWHRKSEFEDGSCVNVADAAGRGLQGGMSRNAEVPSEYVPDWRNFPTQPPVCKRNDGFSGRLAGITFPRWRNGSIKSLGNAVVPQVPYNIFKIIDRIN